MTDQRNREQLRADIEQQRQELGETVNALAHKADVRTRAQEKSTELKEQARQRGIEFKQQAQQDPGTLIGPVIVLLALVAFVRGRRRKKR